MSQQNQSKTNKSTSDPQELGKVGSGSYSEIKKDITAGVAIKVFKSGGNDAAVREIAIMKYLNHPNILSPLHICFSSTAYNNEESKNKRNALRNSNIYNKKQNMLQPDTIFPWNISMKLYDCDLSKLKITSVVTLVEIIKDIISGVKHMHDKHIIHADLKPQNILYDAAGKRAVICDFNISIFDHQTYGTSVLQTPLYRAPEIDLCSVYCKYSNKIDVWSFGCILFEMLSGLRFVISEHCDDDPSIGCMYAFGIMSESPKRISRSERMNILRKLTYDEVFAILRMRFEVKCSVSSGGASKSASSCSPSGASKNSPKDNNSNQTVVEVRKLSTKIVRARFNQCHELTKMASGYAANYSPKKRIREFLRSMLAVIAGCLIPNQDLRWDISKVAYEFEKVLLLFGKCFPAGDYVSTPLCLIEDATNIILDNIKNLTVHYYVPKSDSREAAIAHERVFMEIRILNKLIESFTNQKYSAAILTALDAKSKNVCRNIQLVEIDYYRKTGTKKELGSEKSLRVFSACVYMVCCINSIDEPDEIYAVCEKKDIILVCAEIMNALNYKVII